MSNEYKLIQVTIRLSNGKKAKYMVTAKDADEAKQEVISKVKTKKLTVIRIHCEVVGKADNII